MFKTILENVLLWDGKVVVMFMMIWRIHGNICIPHPRFGSSRRCNYVECSEVLSYESKFEIFGNYESVEYLLERSFRRVKLKIFILSELVIGSWSKLGGVDTLQVIRVCSKCVV